MLGRELEVFIYYEREKNYPSLRKEKGGVYGAVCVYIITALRRKGDLFWDEALECFTLSFRVTPHSSRAYNLRPKLQALVYNIFPPTSAIIHYAVSLGKLSANEQFLLVLKRQ